MSTTRVDKIEKLKMNGEYHYELSTATQMAPRGYIRIVLCFPFHGAEETRLAAFNTLYNSLHQCIQRWPILSGYVKPTEMGSAKAAVCPKGPNDPSVPIRVRYHDLDEENKHMSYDKLKDCKFPISRLLGKDLAPVEGFANPSEPSPVLAVQANFIPNGLLLAVYLHHGAADGNCMAELIDTFAKNTRENTSPRMLTAAPIHRVETLERSILPGHASPQELAKLCPEHIIIPGAASPGQPLPNSEATPALNGCIFVFKVEKLKALKKLVNEAIVSVEGPNAYASTNDCVGALAWVHVSKARFGNQNRSSQISRFSIAVDHRKRLVPALPRNYFGHGASISVMDHQISTLLEASEALSSDSGKRSLGRVARDVRNSVVAVDDTFVRRRLVMGKAVSDMREIGVKMTGEQDVSYNTWAVIGSDSLWRIPGVPVTNGYRGSKPDRVRRPHHSWSQGSCLVLPRRADSDKWELLVQIEASVIDRLREDPGWTHWVDDVIF